MCNDACDGLPLARIAKLLAIAIETYRDKGDLPNADVLREMRAFILGDSSRRKLAARLVDIAGQDAPTRDCLDAAVSLYHFKNASR